MNGVIYGIQNTLNGIIYVGQTTRKKERFAQHKCMLRGGYHENKHLQKAWNENGEDNFRFLILEELPTRFMLEAEKWWIAYFKQLSGVYNITDGGLGTLGIVPWDKGIKRPTETREKISAFAKTRTGEKNPFFGKQHTDETKSKIRAKHSIPVIDLETGDVFPSAKAADYFYGSRNSNVTKNIKKQRKDAYGKQWAYFNEDVNYAVTPVFK